MRTNDRRLFLQHLGIGGAGLLMAAAARAATPSAGKAGNKDAKGADEGISPEEDLMREHGVLKRVLLIYREALRRLDSGPQLDPQVLVDAAGIIRSFIEDYHEKLEEDYLFPWFEKAGKLAGLVPVLRQQHEGGRRLTDQTLRLANAAAIAQPDQRSQLTRSLSQFIRMYEPHEAREDTVLFPEFHQLMSPREHDALGDQFEKREDQLFGENGFEKVVDRVAKIERTLGIYELSQFTPPV
jgi:hemerythrin-like domain-containing protein